ncbi:MAG: MAPEG family protein [Caulobacteraceae bacterium]
MPHLNASAVSILQAVFGMGLLTFVMAGWMTAVRMPAMRKLGVTLQEAAHTRHLAELLPSSTTRVADNYRHLFEAPTAFYAVALAIILAGLADPIYAACAWLFLAARIAHSIVQATFNRVSVRATLYTLSWLCLAIMIVRPLSSL